MTGDEIDELNAITPDLLDLPDLTDIEIGNLDTAPLRAWSEVAEDEGSYRDETVAVLPIDDVMINTAGALPGIEEFIALIKRAYASREPRAIKRYDKIEIQVWASDDKLRHRLMCARDYARERRDS